MQKYVAYFIFFSYSLPISFTQSNCETALPEFHNYFDFTSDRSYFECFAVMNLVFLM